MKSAISEASTNYLERAVDLARDLSRHDVVTGTMLMAYLSQHGCGDYKVERLGHIATELKWLHASAVMGTKRVLIGANQETVWSPTRNERAIRKFWAETPKARGKFAEHFKLNMPDPAESSRAKDRSPVGTVVQLRKR
jgi:hypothetical protein